MKWEHKNALVEALKNNWTAFAGLGPDEKAVLGGCDKLVRLEINVDVRWQADSIEEGGYPYEVFRIHTNYTLPIEAPEGYRLVTIEEREKHSPPERLMCFDRNPKWQGWGENSGMFFNDLAEFSKGGGPQFVFAVPVGFTFGVEELTMEELCEELGRTVKIKR